MSIRVFDLKRVPIRSIDHLNKEDVVRHNNLSNLGIQMLELNKKLPTAKTSADKTLLERQLSATDASIDRLVYELYNLTEDEIKIVEGDRHA